MLAAVEHFETAQLGESLGIEESQFGGAVAHDDPVIVMSEAPSFAWVRKNRPWIEGRNVVGHSDPAVLQELADSLSSEQLVARCRRWVSHLAPFFTRQEREHGCQHRFFMTQVEYCHNLIFRRRAVLDTLHQRLLDANRSMGQPDKIILLFGLKVTKSYRGRLQTTLEDLNLGSPVIQSYYKSSSAKQYMPDTRRCAPSPPPTTYGISV
jgi:hypothetical protein